MFAKVVLFGDSLTQYSFSVEHGGWGALLSDHFQRKADIINRGFSGYNTEWARIILPRLITSLETKPDLVVIFFGANDSALKELNLHQHVASDRYRANLSAMCNYLQSVGLSKSALILVTPPPVCEIKWTEGDRKNAITSIYAGAVVEMGKEEGITTLDLFTELKKQENLGDCLHDGLHFAKKGNKVLASLIIPIIEEKLNLKTPFPDWRDVNPSSLEQTL